MGCLYLRNTGYLTELEGVEDGREKEYPDVRGSEKTGG